MFLSLLESSIKKFIGGLLYFLHWNGNLSLYAKILIIHNICKKKYIIRLKHWLLSIHFNQPFYFNTIWRKDVEVNETPIRGFVQMAKQKTLNQRPLS